MVYDLTAGKPSKRNLEYAALAAAIRKIDLSVFSDGALLAQSLELKRRAAEGEKPDGLLVESYALVIETVKRRLGFRVFDVQILGAISLHKRNIIQMNTGEGKTLVAVMPAYLNALTGKGVHILTFNDYLAARDDGWMGPVFRALGLSVGHIASDMTKAERRNAYACDITYASAKEAGFDLLRDLLAYEADGIVHRPLNYAIVDEADSILIDEARIPLVIADSSEDAVTGAQRAFEIIAELTEGTHYELDENKRNAYFTEKGIDRIETALDCGNIYTLNNTHALVGMSNALHARALLRKDIDYIIDDGRIVIVDEFTGRVVENRHWPDGLQAAVEIKEGMPVSAKGRVMNSIAIQYYLRLYAKIAGMTGTARCSAEELETFYGLDVDMIPPNRPCIRNDREDLVFRTRSQKHDAIRAEVALVHRSGRPILIGTGSVYESEIIAGLLTADGIPCSVLNARNDESEAAVISEAGAKGAVTVSTNMAGRGTDIRLGGRDERQKAEVTELGGLYVIGTTKHESRRIDDQLRGRAGRQGEPGSSRFCISLEDDILLTFDVANIVPRRYFKAGLSGSIPDKVVARRIGHIQRVIEGQNFEIRRTLWNYTFIVEQQRATIHERRQRILLDGAGSGYFRLKCPDAYARAERAVGQAELAEIEKRILLFVIDRCWSDYLDMIQNLRDGIHLMNLGGHNPLDEFRRQLAEDFDVMNRAAEEMAAEEFLAADAGGFDLPALREKIRGPSSTWTYLVGDNPFDDNIGLRLVNNKNIVFGVVGSMLQWPVMLSAMLLRRFGKKPRGTDGRSG